MRGLRFGAERILARRLRADSAAPVAVAVSGGGDSLALALIAAEWAATRGRRLLLLNVDHRLQALSGQWTETCRDLAQRLGADFRALAWEGAKPASGLPAAARTARHRLLADAARSAGASVILTGHTASDRAEAAAMRNEGSSVPDLREWSPSPAWPEGREVFVLRPLIAADRGEIRSWLSEQGEGWIDDPANEDPRFARARVRSAGGGETPATPPRDESLSLLARSVGGDAAGVLSLPRSLLRVGDPSAFVAMACLSASGTTRPPRSERLARLTALLVGETPVSATLAGARIEAHGEQVRFLREAGEAARGGLADQIIAGWGVWDGRFEVTTREPMIVRRLGGLAGRLSKAERDALATVPTSARPGLPVIVTDEQVCCPVLTEVSGVSVRPLAYARLLAAAGAVQAEP